MWDNIHIYVILHYIQFKIHSDEHIWNVTDGGGGAYLTERRYDRLKTKGCCTVSLTHRLEREDRQADRGGEKEVEGWDFEQWFLHFTEWHFERLPWKNPAAVPPPPLRFKALAFISQTDEWHSVRLLCVWILSISILRNDQTKGTQWEKKINCCEDFFFFISIMVPKWCFGADWDAHKHIYPHRRTDSLFSLLTLHHHANPACFTRQETERLIVIPQGSADLSQICLCLAPHSTSFLYCLAPRNHKISHLWDLLEMWEICERSPLPGGFLARAAGKSDGKAEQRWRGRQKEEGFTLLRAPEGYKAKAVLILRENARPGWVWFLLGYYVSLEADWKQ